MSSSLGHFIRNQNLRKRLHKHSIDRMQPGELKPRVRLRNSYVKKPQSLHIVEIFELTLHWSYYQEECNLFNLRLGSSVNLQDICGQNTYWKASLYVVFLLKGRVTRKNSTGFLYSSLISGMTPVVVTLL